MGLSRKEEGVVNDGVTEVTRATRKLRADIRDFLSEHLPALEPERRVNCWTNSDPQFSALLGSRGFVGMCLPRQHGGQGRSVLERYVVIEELLAAGAPVGAHWIADRQTGPLILRYGSEEQKQKYLPGIASGTLYSCIGLSEPGAGSDLASVRTSARRSGNGWILNGQKLWTTNAQHAHVMLALVRTDPKSERSAGLTQFLVDMDMPGVTVRPIVDLAGHDDFNEVFFDDVLLPEDALIGTEGGAWAQAKAELALERSGPERFLSSHPLLAQFIDHVGESGADAVSTELVGRLTARLCTLRQMSIAVNAQLPGNEQLMVQAAMVKDLGSSFEQEVPVAIEATLIDQHGIEANSPLHRMLVELLKVSPSFSLRGGTREILRGIIASGVGAR